MIRTIEIGGKQIEFKASAATSILYKRTFGNDLTSEFSQYVKNFKEVKKLQEEFKVLDDDTDEIKVEKYQAMSENPLISQLSLMAMDLFPKLAYIMWLEAHLEQQALFKKLNELDYITWLSQFESSDLQSHITDFMSMWNENSRTSVKPKN